MMRMGKSASNLAWTMKCREVEGVQGHWLLAIVSDSAPRGLTEEDGKTYKVGIDTCVV